MYFIYKGDIMLSVHRLNLKHFVTSLAISLGTGILSGILTMGAMESFEKAVKPPLTPPSFLFPIVWFILFALMGISAYIVYESDSPYRKSALTIYIIQLAVNFIWPLLFFNMQAYLFSFIWILLLWVLIIIMIAQFYKVSKPAALLQIPYLLWVTFAAYLNFGVYLLN
ncbi:MAG: TspO/MBR family protein [Ruminococcus sp.]|nr:TspO/MBR family protein [Ruminococcus sp.]